MSIEDIEKKTRQYADARTLLSDRVESFEDEKRGLLRRRLPGIRAAAQRAQEIGDELKHMIDAHRDAFKKPKSRVFHGIKVGIVKAKGVIRYANESRVVQLIRKQLPDQAETLIKTTEKPAKSALLNLKADQLKKLGCEVTGSGDQVLIKAQDSELNKLVEALLRDGDNALDEEAAE